MNKRNMKNAILYIVACILCGCVAIPVFSENVVLDEAYTVNLVRGSIADIIAGAAGDVHPPLYYLILKLANLLFGENLQIYRFVTILGTWLNLLVLGATVIRRRWGNRVAIIYLLWFGTSFGTFTHTALLRMYTWGTFWVTAAGLMLYAYYEREKKSSLLFAVLLTLAAMYTHYYAVIAVFFMWLILLAAWCLRRKKIWWILGSGVVIAIGYAPWLRVGLKQTGRVATSYWMTFFDWGEWASAPNWLMDSSLQGIGAVLYTVLIAVILYAVLHREWLALLSGSVFGLTMLTGALVSVLITPMWANRYIYIAWGMLSLMVALVAGQMNLRRTMVSRGCFVILMLFAGYSSVRSVLEDDIMTCDAGAWVEAIETRMDEDAFILADDPGEHNVVYRYYMPTQSIYMTEGNDINAAFMQEFLKASEGKQRWYVIDYVQARCGVDIVTAALEECGYTLVSEGNYSISQKSLELFRMEEAEHAE